MCHRLGNLDQLALFHVVVSCHPCSVDIRNSDVLKSFLGFFDHLSFGNDRADLESVIVTDEDIFCNRDRRDRAHFLNDDTDTVMQCFQ